MKKLKNRKVKYIYIEPKTPEEKERQRKILDEAYNFLFEKVIEKSIKKV